jgi:hypothetical protein
VVVVMVVVDGRGGFEGSLRPEVRVAVAVAREVSVAGGSVSQQQHLAIHEAQLFLLAHGRWLLHIEVVVIARPPSSSMVPQIAGTRWLLNGRRWRVHTTDSAEVRQNVIRVRQGRTGWQLREWRYVRKWFVFG